MKAVTPKLLFILVLLAFVSTAVSRPAWAQNVTSYAGLRAAAGGAGQSVALTSPTNPRIDGTFNWQAADPNGNGDDGGIVLSASGGGWWMRSFVHTVDDPIQLDWYNLPDGADITALLKDLSSAYAPSLYVQMPSVDRTFFITHLNFSAHGVTNLALLEHPSALTTLQDIDGPEGRGWLFYIEYDTLVVGTTTDKGDRDSYNLTLEGTYTPSNRASGLNFVAALFYAAPRLNSGNAYFRANTLDAYADGIHFRSLTSGDTLFVSGRHVNSGVGIFDSAVEHAVFEDAYVSDPYGHKFGWTGSAYDCDTAYKGKGIIITNMHAIGGFEGSAEFQYGGDFGSNAAYMGTGPSDPFVLTVKDPGYLEDGTEMTYSCWLWHTLKFDGLPDEVANQRFFKMVEGPHDYGSNNRFKRIYIESALGDDQAGCPTWQTSHVTWTLVNISNDVLHIWGALFCDGDRIHHMVYQSDGVNPAMTGASVLELVDNDTVKDGQFAHIRLRQEQGHLVAGGVDNTIQNVTLTGRVEIWPSVTNTTLTDVVWTGSAREIMSISSGSDVRATNLTAPVGSTVNGDGTFILNGQQVSLPYTFTGGEGGGNTNAAPVAPNQSVTTDEDQQVNITLTATDVNGDLLTYTVRTQPQHGTLSGLAPNLTYTPDLDYSGSDSFTFVANDGEFDSNEATVSITVNETDIIQNLSLQSGWNTVSLNVEPGNNDIETVVADILPELVLVKNRAGQIYYPELGINHIGIWNTLEAYKINVASPSAFNVEGNAIDVNATSIPLSAGWNLVPYLPASEMPVEAALAPIVSDLVRVMDNEGNIYNPASGVNDIGMMQPGQGYYINVSQATTLTYPGSQQPIAYWPMEGNAVDVSGNGNDLQCSNCPGTTTGVVGSACDFDGNDVLFRSHATLNGDFPSATNNPDAAFTIAAWIELDSVNDRKPIVTKQGDPDRGFVFMKESDHTLTLESWPQGASSSSVVKSQTLLNTTGVAYHVAVVYEAANGGTAHIYVNGVLEATATNFGSSPRANSKDLEVGRYYWNSSYNWYFDGMIDEVKVYDQALSTAEIQSLYVAGTQTTARK